MTRSESDLPEDQMTRSESDSPEDQMTRSEPGSPEERMTRSEPGSPEDQIYKMEWSKTFKEAMGYIYAEKPEIEKAAKLLRGEADGEKNVLAIHELAKLAERELIHASTDEKVGYYNKSLEGFQYVHEHLGYEKSREEWMKRYAAYRIGDMYLTGKGTEVDQEKGEKYLEIAARLENDNAKMRLAAIYLNKEDEILKQTAVKLLEEVSEKGNSLAQYKLGCIYADSKNDNICNMDKAIKYLEMSAQQENPYAQYRLGVIYSDPNLQGRHDMNKAIEYFKAVANQGNQFAQCRLGCIYYFGKGVEQNREQGAYWLHRAAEQGNEYAKKILEAELEIGTGFSYCLVKSTLSAMETMNRQIGQQNQQLSRTQSKQALKEQRMHHKEKEQSIW